MAKFGDSDRVVRVGDNWNWVIQGKVYTVKRSCAGFISLEEVVGEYSADQFKFAGEMEVAKDAPARVVDMMLNRDIRALTAAEYDWRVSRERDRITALNQQEARDLPKPAPAGIFALAKM